MATVERTVRHLKLRARDESLVRSVVLRMEDALRTASLPDAGARLLVVRKLSLGRIPEGISPQSLAILLEQKVASQGIRAVHGVSPGAEDVNAVWFRDTLEACTALALRLASGGLAQGWFWPLAVCGWQPAWGRQESLRWLAFSLAARQEAAVALPRWVLDLVRAGRASSLIDALRLGDGVALLALSGLSVETRSPEAGNAKATDDDRHAWLRKMLNKSGLQALAQEAPTPSEGHSVKSWHPASGLSNVEPTHEEWRNFAKAFGNADAGNDMVQAEQGSEDNQAGFQANQPYDPSRMDAGHPLEKSAENLDDYRGNPYELEQIAAGLPFFNSEESAISSLPVSERQESADSLHGRSQSPQSAESGFDLQRAGTLPRMELGGFPTCAGGLLFLLPVLERLGFGPWLDTAAEWEDWDMARFMLHRVLARLRVCPDDPAWQVVSANRHAYTPNTFEAPESWLGLCQKRPRFVLLPQEGGGQLRDSTGRLLLGAWQGSPSPFIASLLNQNSVYRVSAMGFNQSLPQLIAESWLNACRRWLRRQARMGLADLILRPSLMALTPTHIDISFELNGSDLRVRRAGLDIDPGWVPWFGRVVMFHYDSRRRSAPFPPTKGMHDGR